jgi:hypothetical protein
MSSRKSVNVIVGILFTLFLSIILQNCKGNETTVSANPGTTNGSVSVTVSSPKNGDTLTVGSAFTIQWASNSTSKVKIEYSTNYGATWIVIADNVANNGNYLWSPVPNLVTSQGKIRITTDDNTASNVSSGSFNVYKPSGKLLVLSKPNGGEILNINESFRIEWVASNVTSIRIEFSTNNGSSYNLIIGTFPADSGYYVWQPIPNFPSTQCILKITDVSNDSVTDKSKSTFTIASPQAIRITSPNGGESWPGNSGQTITWYSSQVSSVKIEYTLDNGNSWTTITSSTLSTGTFLWNPIPNIPSTNARIRISDAVDGFPSVASDSVFTISPQPALKIIVPDGGENWMSGTSQTVRWNSLGKIKPGGGNQLQKYLKNSPYFTQTIANIKIELTTDNGADWTTVIASTPNNGSYLWNPIPSQNSSLCRVRLSDADAGLPFAISDSTFVIYNNIPREIVIKTPNGGDVWQAGTTQIIKWNSTGVTAVNIDFTTNNGIDWLPVVANIPSSGYYSWTQVPNNPSNNCKVRITDAVNGFPSSTSTSTFTIAPPPDVTVSSPNGGETIQSGSDFNITWTSTNVANVKIEYTTNNGANWNSIVATTPSIGRFTWQGIPSINSSLCRIKISSADGSGQPFDISDNNFTITNQIVQTLKLLSPVGGEVWQAGTPQNITWNGNAVNSVKIEFTTNNGIDWTLIAGSVLGSGSYAWSLPDINSTQCKVRISDATDGSPSDVSNSVFTIKPVASISIIAPQAGDVFVAGDPVTIKWTSTGIQNVKIEYTNDNGVLNLDWHSIVDNTPSNGSYVTSFSIPTNQYRIRISEALTGSPMAYSNGVFTVSPQSLRTITVVSPNLGTENWLVGTTNEIRWTSTNIDSVKLEYTIDGGANWKTIANSVPSNGLYNWAIPSTDFRSDLCLIRVSNTKQGTPSDISDAYFSIHPNTKLLRWVFPNGGEFIYQDTLITWISTGVANVNIEYTDDNGNTWNPVVTNYHSTGAFFWVLPASLPSTLARLRIYDSSDPTITDMSDSYFNLHIKKGLSIIAPGAYTSSAVGKDMNISWNGDNTITSVRIEYWSDNSKSWNLIADNVPSTYKKVNNYIWQGTPQNKGNIQIRLTDSKGKYTAKSGTVTIN